MKVVDLFCGAGGFSEGFKQAGFEIVAGVDNWGVALQSFAKNFPDAETIYKDVRYLKAGEIPYYDVLIGSPPCQEWSIGNQGKRTFDVSLINAFQKICKQTKPKYWVWECVPPTCNITSPYCENLNAYNFGVPQVRKRSFHSNFPLPDGNQEGSSLNDVFGWEETKVLFNHHSLNTKAHTPVYLSNRPARTAVTWPIRIYKEEPFTVEMMKKVQGFSEDFYFAGDNKDKFTQIGNAVCPPVAKAIAERILGVVE